MEKLYKILNGERIEFTEEEYLKYYEDLEINVKLQKEEAKNARLLEVKHVVEEKIYNKYPLFKQCNIAIYGSNEEKDEFKKFHDEKVAEYDIETRKILIDNLK